MGHHSVSSLHTVQVPRDINCVSSHSFWGMVNSITIFLWEFNFAFNFDTLKSFNCCGRHMVHRFMSLGRRRYRNCCCNSFPQRFLQNAGSFHRWGVKCFLAGWKFSICHLWRMHRCIFCYFNLPVIGLLLRFLVVKDFPWTMQCYERFGDIRQVYHISLMTICRRIDNHVTCRDRTNLRAMNV